jgi:late competence protein required for DNA uptake (superfamily II DNA/RNA helicase)
MQQTPYDEEEVNEMMRVQVQKRFVMHGVMSPNPLWRAAFEDALKRHWLGVRDAPNLQQQTKPEYPWFHGAEYNQPADDWR